MVRLLCLIIVLLSSFAQAGQLSTRYAYDEAGNKIAQTDAQGRITRWNYTLVNQVASHTLPDGSTERFSYDGVGNLSSYTDFIGQITRYAYDINKKLILTQHPDGRSIKTTYGKNGLPETVTETFVQNGKTISLVTRYSYDIMDKLLKVEYPNGQLISYSYDVGGRVTTRSTQNGTSRYAYDAGNHLTQVTDSKGNITTYTYDAMGSLRSTQYPNNTQSLREYSMNGHMQQIAWKDANNHLVTASKYTLLANGQRSAITRYDAQSTLQIGSITLPNGSTEETWQLSNPAYQIDYSYDALQRLKGEHHTNFRNQSELTLNWTYDSTGNRLSQTRINTAPDNNGQPQSSTETTSYHYDERDRLLSATILSNTGSSTTTAYQWDANGRLTKKIAPAQVTLYTWRSDDKLLEVKQGTTEATAQTVAKYAYDSQGNRIQRAAAKVTNYLTDTNFADAQTLEETDITGNSQNLIRYEWGNALISAATGNQPASFYHQDGLGSVQVLTNAQGQPTESYEYEAFGNLTQPTSTANSYRYTGEYSDQATGLQYNRARWYDGSYGRFLSIDPSKGSMRNPITLNKYVYANVDAANKKDPSGYMTTGEVLLSPSFSTATTSFAVPKYAMYTAVVTMALIDAYLINNVMTTASLEESGYYMSNAKTKEEIAQESAERKEYKKRCTEPSPPGLTGCELLKWKLKRNQECKSMRENFSKKWYNDNDPTHMGEIQNMGVAIQKLEELIAQQCK